METDRKYCVYVDYREDDGTPFYVGKGKLRRSRILERNQFHTHIKNKHGMIRKVLFENLTEEESFEKEIQLIQELETYIHYGKGGANLTLGGEGISGLKRDDETKEKVSESSKRLWGDPEFREKMKKSWEDPERKSKISEIMKDLWKDSARKERIGNSIKEHHADPEFRRKQGEKMREVLGDPELRKKISEITKEKLSDPEIRKKISKSSKEKWENPEYKEKMSKSMKERWGDPEFREKMIEHARLNLEKTTPEERSERIRKGWETRRLKKLQQE